MVSGKLGINTRIELKVKDPPYKGTYNSKIEKIMQNTIEVLTPFKNGEIVPLRKGMFLEVFYTGKNAAYKFRSRVIDRRNTHIPVLTIKAPEEIIRVQRRDFFRLEIPLSLEYCLIDEEGEQIEPFKETICCDLSGGGIRIIIEEKIEIDSLIKFKLNGIPELKNKAIIGKVVNIYEEDGGLSAGIEFVEISSNVRDVIIGWLFDKQRELRRKGLL